MTKASDNLFPKVLVDMSTSDPAAPSDRSWKLYAKAGGMYARSSNSIVGPFGTGGGGGGPSDYVSGPSGSGQIIIPGIYGDPDIVPGSPGASDDEFNTTDSSDPMTGWTTLGTPTTHSMNTLAKSVYYVKKSATGTLGYHGIYKANPSMPFTMTAKLSDASIRADDHAVGIMAGEASPGKMINVVLTSAVSAGGVKMAVALALATNPTTFGSTNTAVNIIANAPMYLRLVVTSSTNIAGYWSRGGYVWSLVNASVNPSFTVGSVGLFVLQDNATYDIEAAFDWVRFT